MGFCFVQNLNFKVQISGGEASIFDWQCNSKTVGVTEFGWEEEQLFVMRTSAVCIVNTEPLHGSFTQLYKAQITILHYVTKRRTRFTQGHLKQIKRYPKIWRFYVSTYHVKWGDWWTY